MKTKANNLKKTVVILATVLVAIVGLDARDFNQMIQIQTFDGKKAIVRMINPEYVRYQLTLKSDVNGKEIYKGDVVVTEETKVLNLNDLKNGKYSFIISSEVEDYVKKIEITDENIIVLVN